MKIKSLLMAVAAFAALSATAQSITTPDIKIESEEDFGQLIEMPITLETVDNAQWTNIEFHFTFPQGLYPKIDEYETYCFEGADITRIGRAQTPAVSYSSNFDVEENWPNYKVVGANMSDTPNPAGEVLIVNVEVREGVENGEYPIKAYVKFNRADGELDGREVGTPEEEVEFAKLIVNLPVVAVNDINAAKAVSSVKYYNAAGMESDKAFEGINIVVTKYADGSQSTAKVVK
jgi:hypothetical protein